MSTEFELLSTREVLQLEEACDRFTRDVRAGVPASPQTYLENPSSELLTAVKQEFATIRKEFDADGGTIHPDLEKTLNGESGVLKGLEEGILVGKFRLIRRLGRGATAEVWRAIHVDLDREVALKFPFSCRDESKSRFVRESQAIARLRHPNIVALHDVGEFELEGVQRNYLVSDYIQGQTLADILSSRQEINVEESVEWMIQIVEAVSYSHSRDVVHRDLKPQNVILNSDSRPMVTDYGLARILEEGSELLTREGELIGTPAYMSPEQARGENDLSVATDIYSSGVILFRLLTGDLPFRGSIQSIVHQIIYRNPPKPRSWNPRIPQDLETICLKCLEKRPEDRFLSADFLLSELHRFQNGVPIVSRPISAWEHLKKWAKRNPAVASMFAVTGFLLIALAVGGITFGLFMDSARKKEARLRAEAVDSETRARAANEARIKALEEAIQHRSLAEQRAAESEKAFQFLSSVFQKSDPVSWLLSSNHTGRPPDVRDLFLNAADQVALEFPGNRRIQARMCDSLGNSSRAIGLFKEAEKLLLRARELRQSDSEFYLPGEFEFEKRQNRFFLALLQHDKGNFPECESEYKELLNLASPTTNEELLRATILFEYGRLSLYQSRNALAQKCFEDCRVIRLRHLGEKSALTIAAEIANEYCNCLKDELPSVEKLKKLFGDQSWPKQAIGLYAEMATCRFRNDQVAAAEKYKKLVSLLREKLSESHPVFLMAMGDYAGVLFDKGDYKNASAVIRFAMAGAQRIAPQHELLKEAHLRFGRELYRNAEYNEAIRYLENARDGVSTDTLSGQSKRVEVSIHLVWCYLKTGELEKAKQEADYLRKHVVDRSPEFSSWIYFISARVYQEIGLTENPYDQKARQILKNFRKVPGNSIWCQRLAIMFLHFGEYERAVKISRRGVELDSQRFHPQHPRVATRRIVHAKAVQAFGNLPEALTQAKLALQIRRATLPVKNGLINEAEELVTVLERKLDTLEKRSALGQ